MSIRVIFMGSPEFALPSLKKLNDEFEVVGVVTQPDRPKGRGKKLSPPPVKSLAESLGIALIQPQTLKESSVIRAIQDWNADVIAVAAFGQILRQEVLDLPPMGCINVHPSLLPRWRGASPIQSAILHGDKVTGVSIMRLVKELDAGPVFDQVKVEIAKDDTGGTLETRLSELGADLLVEVIKKYHNREIDSFQQDENLVTYAGRIEKTDGEIDLKKAAVELERKIRAFNPVPGAFINWQSNYLKIHKVHIIKNEGEPGARAIIDGFPAICTIDSWLVLDEVQPAGKKSMTGDVFLRGARNWINTKTS